MDIDMKMRLYRMKLWYTYMQPAIIFIHFSSMCVGKLSDKWYREMILDNS